MPDDRLTLAGTTRLIRDGSPSLQTGPAVARIKIKPVVQLEIDAGRIDVQLDADLDDAAGSLNHLELALPHDLVVLSVESDALTDWSRPAPRQLLLRYDRAFSRSRRRLRITGWIPVLEDPLKIGIQQLEVPTPWLEVTGMETVSAALIILSVSRLQAISAPGLTLLPAGPTPTAGGTDARARQVYRVEDPAKLGFLQWSSAPPRVNVLIESQITIHPDSAEWVAVLRYDVAGGALDSIHLKLPTTWATRAQVDLAGDGLRSTVRPARSVHVLEDQADAAGLGVSARRAAFGTPALARPGTPASRDRAPGRGSPIPTSALSTRRARRSRLRARVDCTRSATPTGSRTRSLATFPEPTPGRSMSSGTTGR